MVEERFATWKYSDSNQNDEKKKKMDIWGTESILKGVYSNGLIL